MKASNLSYALLLTLGLCACGDTNHSSDPNPAADAGSGADAQPPPDKDPLPLLQGSHAGIIMGFNGFNPVTTAAQMDARFQEAIDAGMKIGRVQLDWGNLEPDAGQFDLSALTEPLAQLKEDGLQPFVSLGTYEALDLGEQLIPRDLQDKVAAGTMTWDDPELVSRFKAMLDKINPALQEHGVWIISLGNEAGNILDDMPPALRQAETDALVSLWGQARDHLHSIAPKIAVSITIREQGYETELDFIDVSDVVTFNFYCSRFADDLKPATDPTVIRGYIDNMLTLAEGKPLVLQELGCHGGYEDKPSPTSASLQTQQDFYKIVFEELEARPLFRAAVVFQMVDWDPELTDAYYSQALREEGIGEAFIEQFAESLDTVGMLRYEDGSARPAWDTFLEAL